MAMDQCYTSAGTQPVPSWYQAGTQRPTKKDFKMKKFHILVDDITALKFRNYRNETGIPVSKAIRKALDDYTLPTLQYATVTMPPPPPPPPPTPTPTPTPTQPLTEGERMRALQLKPVKTSAEEYTLMMWHAKNKPPPVNEAEFNAAFAKRALEIFPEKSK